MPWRRKKVVRANPADGINGRVRKLGVGRLQPEIGFGIALISEVLHLFQRDRILYLRVLHVEA